MLICNVVSRPRNVAIAVDIVETATASDANTIGNIVFAAVVDAPASVTDRVDAYFGQVMAEQANAIDTYSIGMIHAASVNEPAAARDTLALSVSVPPVTASTWNPADKSANITLSVGNLTVGATTIAAGAVRSTQSKAIGKLYFENTWTSPTGGAGGDATGIGTGTAALSGLPANGAGGCIVYVNGLIMNNGAGSGVNIGAIATGQAHCVAVDLVNSRIWFRINGGLWNNSGTANPATNVGGINISTLFPANAAFAVACKNGTVPTCRTNFGASAFTQAIPSGFTSWNGATSPVTWNPLDISTGVSLSNGNLTATGTSTTGSYFARATSSRSSGKHYFETKVTGVMNNVGPGIALPSADLNFAVSIAGEVVLNLTSGNVFVNSQTVQGNVGTYALNDICCLAVDLDNKKIWFRKNGGLWDNNATHDPATNTGGFSISFISTSIVFPMAYFSAPAAPSALTANFGATAFAQTIPSGFTAWQS